MSTLQGQLALFPSSHAKQPAWYTHPIFNEVEPAVFRQFKEFHAENPGVYQMFKRYAYQAKASGRSYYSAKAIVERLRWDLNMDTTGGEFKITNSITSCYPRLLIIEAPEFESFFRRQRAA